MEVKARLQRIMELLVWRKQNLEGNERKKVPELDKEVERRGDATRMWRFEYFYKERE